MGILGLGTDLVEVARVRQALERHGERFRSRVLTAGERREGDMRPDPAQHLALRFAAKEAGAKALGTGLRGVRLRDLEVRRDPGGPPRLVLDGGAAERAGKLGVERIHLSLSDEGGFALATVILEGGDPAGQG